MGRKQSREIAFKLLFALAFDKSSEVTDESSLELVCERETPDETEMAFIEALCGAVKRNLEAIDKLIAEHAKGFTFDRIFKIDLTALRMAIGEVLFTDGGNSKDTKAIAIDTAVEIVKKYSTGKSSAFVNGVLSQILN